jgi:hypothetical protein
MYLQICTSVPKNSYNFLRKRIYSLLNRKIIKLWATGGFLIVSCSFNQPNSTHQLLFLSYLEGSDENFFVLGMLLASCKR